MRSYFVLLLLGIFCSCQQQPKKDAIVLAEANGKKLYQTEFHSMFPSQYSIKDSIDMAQSFIDQWVRKTILIDEAEKKIAKDIDIQQLVDDYKASLILDIFEKKLVESTLDTIVTDQQIQKNYDENIDQFYLKKDVALCLYAKIPEDAKGLDKFYENWKKHDIGKIRNYCKTHCKDSLLKLDRWFYTEELSKILPDKMKKKIKWEKDLITQNNINDFEYFIWVKDIVKAKEPAPLSFVREKIIKLIIHQRKKRLLYDYENNLLKEKIKNKEVILH